jgi:hypothetical protein
MHSTAAFPINASFDWLQRESTLSVLSMFFTPWQREKTKFHIDNKFIKYWFLFKILSFWNKYKNFPFFPYFALPSYFPHISLIFPPYFSHTSPIDTMIIWNFVVHSAERLNDKIQWFIFANYGMRDKSFALCWIADYFS